MDILLRLALATVFSAHLAKGNVYCIKPSVFKAPCGNGQYLCEDLQYYASNSTFYFSSDTTMEFLPGEHSLRDANVLIKGVNNLKLTGESKACTFEDHSIKPQIVCPNSSFLFQNITNLTLLSLSFSHCGQWVPPSLYGHDNGTAKATLAFDTVLHLSLVSLSVSHSSGYGVLVYNTHGHSVIRNCELTHNKGGVGYLGGNILLNYISCPGTWQGSRVEVIDSVFSFGYFEDPHNTSGGIATGIAVTLSCTGVNISMRNITAEGNQNSWKGFGGNVFVHFFSEHHLLSNTVSIRDSHFLNGSSWLGGGIFISAYIRGKNKTFDCRNRIYIANSVVSGNHAATGSAVYINIIHNLMLNNCSAAISLTDCTLSNNNLARSGGGSVGVITILDERVSGVSVVNRKTLRVSLRNVTLKHSTANVSKYHGVSAALYVRGLLESLYIIDSKFQHNHIAAIAAFRSHLTFQGMNTIVNNVGVNGGGFLLCESSTIIITPNTTHQHQWESCSLSQGEGYM